MWQSISFGFSQFLFFQSCKFSTFLCQFEFICFLIEKKSLSAFKCEFVLIVVQLLLTDTFLQSKFHSIMHFYMLLSKMLHFHAQFTLVYGFLYTILGCRTALQNLEKCEFERMALFCFTYCFGK